MRTQRMADITSGAFLAALGVLSLVASYNIAGVTGEQLHPRTLPVFLSWVISLAGVALIFGGWRNQDESQTIDWPDKAGFKRLLMAMACMILYLLLIEPLGFATSSFLMLAFLIWYLSHYHPVTVVLLSLVTAVIIYFLFIQFLGLTFPVGPLGW